jgi:crossover junction endodeoxyribonuclease RuvC
MEIVEPSAWKRFWKLPGKDKEAARQKALQLFPDVHEALARKRDHGRAESALIALYGAASRQKGISPVIRENSPRDRHAIDHPAHY